MVREATFDTSSASQEMLQPQYMQRSPNFYAVSELEMEMLATWNNLSTLAFTLSGSFVSFGVGILVQSAMTPDIAPKAQAIVSLGVPMSILMALMCCLAGLYLRSKRSGTLSQIKTESRALPARTIA